MRTSDWIEKIEDRIGHWGIPHITRGIVALNILIFILSLINADFIQMLTLDPYAISTGEVWRLVTFLFIPGTQSVIWIIFYLLFTWYVGEALEGEWGAFKLNLYFLIGMIALALTAFFVVKNQVDNVFLFSSLLLAFGTCFPQTELIIFPIPIPIQARFLAMFDGLMLVVYFIFNPYLRPIILASVANYILFFLPPTISDWHQRRRSKERMKSFK